MNYRLGPTQPTLMGQSRGQGAAVLIKTQLPNPNPQQGKAPLLPAPQGHRRFGRGGGWIPASIQQNPGVWEPLAEEGLTPWLPLSQDSVYKGPFLFPGSLP
ncbi:RING finger protein 112-like protein [Platysternon megacephalum]|uniref:RING finger protein 112-like protein n=1 Tax=Platysternon megacephalum TaxID=55544 RepID=A0A4D9DWP3_9SAUR|nr:RING finger protein 112-like protein [Platysternon megacephalum]